MYAFDHDKRITDVLKGETTSSTSAALSKNSPETDRRLTHSSNPEITHSKINYAFKSDENLTNYGKKLQKNFKSVESGNNSEWLGHNALSLDKDIKSNEKTDIKRNDASFYGTAGYYVDDYETTSSISLVSDDNWTLQKSSSLRKTENAPSDVLRGDDINDYLHDNDPATAMTSSDKKCSDKDVKNILGVFDYLDDYHSQTDSSNVSLCGSGTDHEISIQSIGVGETRNDNEAERPKLNQIHEDIPTVKDILGVFDYLDEYHSKTNSSNVSLCGSGTDHEIITKPTGKVETGNDNEAGRPNVNRELEAIPSVKDILGVFDYLDEYHSRTNSISTASQCGSEDKLNFDDNRPMVYSPNDRENKIENNDYENVLEKKLAEDEKVLDERRVNHISDMNRKHHVQEGIKKNKETKDPYTESSADYENALKNPFQKDRNEEKLYRHMNYGYEDTGILGFPEDKSYNHMAYGIKDTPMRTPPDSYSKSAYHKKKDSNARHENLIERTRSEEVVSSFTHGEFILRRTQSEEMHNQNGAFKQKGKTQMEILPEDTSSVSTEAGSVHIKEKPNIETDYFDACGFLLKALAFILFGIGATEIILGIILRKACEIEEIVPISTLVSGGMCICYCIIYMGINIYRKRNIKISRSFRTFLVVLWTTFLGMIIAGGVLLYPSINDYAFRDCDSDEDCCRRKFILISFGAMIIDVICQICFVIGLCCL